MLRMKGPVSSGLLLLGILFLAGCTSRSQKISTRPVAQVNDHQITAKEFANKLARRLKDLDALSAKDPLTVQNAKDEIIKSFILRSLALDWARTQNLSVSEKELDAEIESARANYPDDLSFRRALAQENLSFSEWREEMRYSMIEKLVFKKIGEKIKSPTDDEIRRAYEEKKDSFRKKDRIYLRQIVTDDEAKADLIKAELKKKDFAETAKKYSSAPEAKEGGLVGWIEKGSVDFFDPAFNLPIGAVSSIIKSPFGYHILKVEKKLPASKGTLDEVRPLLVREIRAKKEQSEFVAWLDGQIRSSKVLKDQELIHSVTVDTRSSNE